MEEYNVVEDVVGKVTRILVEAGCSDHVEYATQRIRLAGPKKAIVAATAILKSF